MKPKPGSIIRSICPVPSYLWRTLHNDDMAGEILTGDLMIAIDLAGDYYLVLHPTLGVGYFWSDYVEVVTLV